MAKKEKFMKHKNEVDNWLDAAVGACCIMDFRTFGETVAWFAYDPLIAKSWTKRILKMISDCKKAKLNPKETAILFPTMSQLRCMMIFDLWMSKYANTSRQERIKIFNFYNSLLKAGSLEDPHAVSKNIIHSKKEINDFLLKVTPGTPSIAKVLGRLVNACYHLGHAMYSDMNPSVVYENYGPYDVSNVYGPNHIVAIKEFGNLKATELWPESGMLPCNFIQIIYVYKDIKMTVDTCSHAIYEGNLISGLKYFSLKIDSKDYLVDKLDKTSEAIEKLTTQIFQKFQALDLENKKEKYYFMKAYVYKKIYERLEQDWRPSEEILAEARGKKLLHLNWPEDKNKQKEIVRKILDPRIEFYY